MPDTFIMSDYVYDYDNSDSLHTWEKLGCLVGEGNALCSDIEFIFSNDTLILEYIGIGIDFYEQTFIVSDSGGLSDTALVYFNLNRPEGTSDIGSIPHEYSLSQNHPNPFNPVTTIEYTLPRSGEVSLIVYNLLGEQVVRLVNNFQSAATYEISWDASSVASGIYFYRLQSGDFVQTRKMLLLK